jgi:soluble cytochrome b562
LNNHGVLKLSEWLDKSEAVVAYKVPAKTADIQRHVEELEFIINESSQLEWDFKATSSLAQTLAKSTNQQAAKEMLDELRNVKERLVRVRSDATEKQKSLKTVNYQVESMETGFGDLLKWLDGCDDLLLTHRIDGDINSVEDRLVNHMTFFKKTNYYRGVLESKMKTLKTLQKLNCRHLNLTEIDELVLEINRRFQDTVVSSTNWEHRLQTGLDRWRHLQQKAQPIEDWLERTKILTTVDPGDAFDELVDSLKNCIDGTDGQLSKDFIEAGQRLLSVVCDEDRADLEQSLLDMQRHQEVG